MTKTQLFFLQIIFLVIFINNKSHAQMVGTDAFIKGLHLEIGIAGSGGYEGTSAVPPAGMHPRGGLGLFGFVADPLLSSWTNYNGDYFTPGSPENGWGIWVGNTGSTATDVSFSNNCNAPINIPGSISGYTSILDCRNIFWSGSATSGTTSIATKINYFLDQTELYYTTTITFTNNSSATIPTMYYYRNVDPDNNESLSGSFTTQNLIENQPAGACNIACVSASQTSSAGSGASYMAFAGLDPEFRVSYGGFSNRSGYDIWNGFAGLTGTIGSTNFADEAISIAFRIQNFLPGTSRSFKFVTILGSADKIKAVNNLFSLTYPGSSTVAPVACSPVVPPDTVKICGPTIISVAGPGLTGFTWSWSPTSFLSSSTTFSATVNPPTTTVYTITGIPTNTCVGAPLSYTIVVKPNIIGLTISPSATYCPGTTILLTASGAGIGGSYSWTGPNSFTSPIQSPSIPSCSLISAGIYTAVITTSAGCIATTTTNISVLSAISSFSIPVSTKCLTGNSFSFISTGTVGGTHSYSFSPSIGAPPSGSTPSYTGSFSAPGTYTVTHTVVSGGCTSISTLTVVVNPMPSVSGTATNASCGLSNGVIVINNLSGAGQGPFVFTNNGTAVPSQTITGLAAGTYTLGITNVFGCIFTNTVSVTTSPPITALALTPINVICGAGFGSITLGAVTGGTPTYSYSVNGGGYTTTPVLTGLTAGNYTISVKDIYGCIFSQTVAVTVSTGPSSISGISSPASCGLSNGSYSITGVTGGAAAYTYSINGVATGTLITGLAVGIKTITVKDANGCLYTQTISILSTSGPSSVTITVTNASCGLVNGISTVTGVTGGVGPYTYSFDGGVFGVGTSVSGLASGTHTVVIKDASLCTYTLSYNVLNSPPITNLILTPINVICGAGFGSITLGAVTGGTPTYSYSVNGGGYTTTPVLTGLSSGSYTISVKDIYGCTFSQTVAVTVTTGPSAISGISTPAGCGLSNGSYSITGVTGGTAAYTYSINGVSTGSVCSGLTLGTKTITVRDVNGCIYNQTITIGGTVGPTLISGISTPASCGLSNGSYSITGVTGGTAAYTYSINGVSTGSLSSGLAAGVKTLTVKDAIGCIYNQTISILAITGPSSATITTTNATCGLANGSSTVTGVTGGVGPYTYSFDGGAFGVTASSSGLVAGTHSVVIKDASLCTYTMTYNILNAFAPTATVSASVNITCFGLSNGSFTLASSGGSGGPYSYTLTSPFTVNGTGIFGGLPSGTYNITVKDILGCSTTASVVLTQPSALTLTSTAIAVKCFGTNTGTINISGSGGTGAYMYQLNGGAFQASSSYTAVGVGTHTVTIRDVNLCTSIQTITVTQPSVLTSSYTSLPSGCGIANGSATISVLGGTPSYTITWNTLPPQTGTIATGLTPGSWLGLITDANGCTLTQTANVLSAVSPTITGFVIGQPKCFGMSNGSLTVNYSGGVSPYTVSWASPISIVAPGLAGLSHSVTGVAAGVFTATVMDSYGCMNSMSVSVSQPSLLVNTVGTNTAICYGQSASIFSQGLNGTAPYTYTWAPSILVGAGPHTVNPLVGTSYSVYVTDANACTTSPQIITINVGPQLIITGTSSTRCDGDTSLIGPSITSPGNGGPYSYTWNTSSTAASISAIASFPSTPNHYTVTIDDGCSLPASAVFTINVNPLPAISFSSNVLSGCAPLAFTLTANTSGINDVYYWDNPINDFGNPKSIVFADSGKYTLTLVQTNTLTGCKATLTKVNYIEVYPRPIASFIADPQSVSILYPTINFQNTTQGATSYNWNFGDASALGSTNTSVLTNPNHSYSYVGSYGVFLVATSNKGCKDTAQLVVDITPDFVLYIPNIFTPDGNGVNDFFLPMGVGIDENNYRMEVYDRWGELVFTSDKFSKGWDGTIKGNKIGEQAVYVYKIIVNDLQGNKHPFVGHISLLNNN